MEDIFLNSAKFAKHTFLTLVPACGYALNLKALIKFSYEIIRFSFERKIDKANFISPEKRFPKARIIWG